MKLELHFSPIDGKDQGPIHAVYDYCIKTEHNRRVLQQATKEYFERFLALQNELKAKYDNQFQNEDLAQELHWEEESVIDKKINEEVWGNKYGQPDHFRDLYYT